MPEVSHLQFGSNELLEILIKEADIHEGKWVLSANFGVAPGNYGPSVDKVSPGILITVTHLGIQRATDDTPVGMWVDASVINPAE